MVTIKVVAYLCVVRLTSEFSHLGFRFHGQKLELECGLWCSLPLFQLHNENLEEKIPSLETFASFAYYPVVIFVSSVWLPRNLGVKRKENGILAFFAFSECGTVMISLLFFSGFIFYIKINKGIFNYFVGLIM